MHASPVTCPACGTPSAGNFCSACGASLVARRCAGCEAELSPLARFCHRCGRPALRQGANPGLPRGFSQRDRTAWIVAGGLCLALITLILVKVIRSASGPVAPEMANAGAEGTQSAATPPDITRMSPRERFDRLFNRIMQSAEQGDTAQVERFTPMALGAYAQLDTIDADARYHAAALRLQVGDMPGSLALADTILRQNPGHLFAYVIRGEAARAAGDSAGMRRAERDFRTHYDAEMAANRPEYREHQTALDKFNQQAQQAQR
jgi:double zinc ribbon protein